MSGTVLFQVTEKDAQKILVPPDCRVVLSNIALSGAKPGESARVLVCHNDQEQTVGTLIAGTINQARLKLVLPSNKDEAEMLGDSDDESLTEEDYNKLMDEKERLSTYEIEVVGKGTVHVLGFSTQEYPTPDEDYDDDDEDDEDDEEEEDDDEQFDKDDD